jgi:hypothetical protein
VISSTKGTPWSRHRASGRRWPRVSAGLTAHSGSQCGMRRPRISQRPGPDILPGRRQHENALWWRCASCGRRMLPRRRWLGSSYCSRELTGNRDGPTDSPTHTITPTSPQHQSNNPHATCSAGHTFVLCSAWPLLIRPCPPSSSAGTHKLHVNTTQAGTGEADMCPPASLGALQTGSLAECIIVPLLHTGVLQAIGCENPDSDGAKLADP